MSRATWADVDEGDVVDLNGREWAVAKIKRKGKGAKLKIVHKGRTSAGEVKLKDRVKIVRRAADVDPVQDREGAQRRWATPAELAAEMKRGLKPGNPEATKPSSKPKGEAWGGKPSDPTEKMLAKTLGATLIAEATDEGEGWHVPPVDVSTVAAHLALMHGTDPSTLSVKEMFTVHDGQHIGAEREGAALAVNHWHTKRRP